MKTFQQFVEAVIDYKMAKANPKLGLSKGKALSKRSPSSAAGNGDGSDGGDGGDGE
jgi:hypothetical protein